MSLHETLKKLELLGNEKMRTLHKKNGAGDNLFGVKLGDIRTLANTIKTNHELALALWGTGNIDAMLLATLIIAPQKLSLGDMDNMVRAITLAQVADWFNAYVLKEYPDKEMLREQWMESDNPMAARAGWSLTSGRIARQPDGLDIPSILSRLEKEMPAAPPEVQWTMNSALANVGIHVAAYRDIAIGIGERLGIYRDYPTSKGCTSPFAPIWINEMVKRQGK